MSVTPSVVTSDTNALPQMSFTTASVSPTAVPHLLFVWGKYLPSDGTPVPVVTGNGLTWEGIGEGVEHGNIGGVAHRLWVYRAYGAAPSTGAITIDFGQTCYGAGWVLVALTGADTGGTNGSEAVAQHTFSPENPASASAATVTLGSAISDGNVPVATLTKLNSGAMTGTGGWTSLAFVTLSNPPFSMSTIWNNSAADDSASWTWTTAAAYGAVVLEIKSQRERRSVPATVGIAIAEVRSVPATVGLTFGTTREVPATGGVQLVEQRVVPPTAGIQTIEERSVPATVGLILGGQVIRTVPATVGITLLPIATAIGTGAGGPISINTEIWRATIANQLVEDLSSLFVSGQVELNMDRATRLTANITMRDPARVAAYADYIAIFLSLGYEDAREDERIQLGLYRTRIPPGVLTVERAEATFALEGLESLLAMSAYANTDNNAAGFGLRAEIIATLAEAGITRYSLPADTSTHPDEESWPIGTRRLDKINHLAAHLGWYNVWMDLDGRVSAAKMVKLHQLHPYLTLQDKDLHAPVAQQPLDTSLANVVIVVHDNPGEVVLTSVARNDDAASPTSTVNLGEVPRVETRSDLGTQAAADALAASLLSEGRSYYQTATLTLLPHTGIGIHQTVDLALTGKLAELNGRWWVRTWRMGLRPDNALVVMEVNRTTNANLGVVV